MNEAIQEKLQKKQQIKEELKQKKIAGYQRASKNQVLQKELEIYDEAAGDGME